MKEKRIEGSHRIDIRVELSPNQDGDIVKVYVPDDWTSTFNPGTKLWYEFITNWGTS